MSGIAGGAEAVVIPESPTELPAIEEAIRSAYRVGKAHAIVVVAEGADYDGAALIEYALLCALVALAAVVGMNALGGGINTAFNKVNNTLQSKIP